VHKLETFSQICLDLIFLLYGGYGVTFFRTKCRRKHEI